MENIESMLREVVSGGYLDRYPNQKERAISALNEANHYHEAKYVDGVLVRECNRCGGDLMHESHIRQG